MTRTSSIPPVRQLTPTMTYRRSAFAFVLTLVLSLGAVAQSPKARQPLPEHEPILAKPIHPKTLTKTLKKALTKIDKRLIAQLDQRIPHLMSEADIPGLSIALIRNAEVVWSHGFGLRNSETREPVDDTTVFEAASLSKPVFAYAVLKLVDSGKLDLDTPLTKYLPGRYDVGDDSRLDQITARRVLSHTTGFPNWRPRGDATLKIHFTPGDRFSYSGEGFVYLARVVEHITGETLDAFMKRTVLDPLGMKSSSFVWRDDYEARKTFTHNSIGMLSGRDKPEKANAAASLHTTANDYARFVCEIIRTASVGHRVSGATLSAGQRLNYGTASGSDRVPVAKLNSTGSSRPSSQADTGLKPTTARLMLTPQISVTDAGFNNLNSPEAKLSTTISWGLGWGLEKTHDGMAFWHWGDNGDTKAYVEAFQSQKTGIVMFANSANGLSIINEVVDNALGGQHPVLAWINVERYNSPARLMFKAILKSDAEAVLADYRKRRQEAANSRAEGKKLRPESETLSFKPETRNSKLDTNDLSLSEAQMNRLGYQLLGLKRIKDAIAVFKQNTVDFPDAFNTWDSLAESLMISGDKESAIKYYKKSLELNPNNTNAVQKLKELGA